MPDVLPKNKSKMSSDALKAQIITEHEKLLADIEPMLVRMKQAIDAAAIQTINEANKEPTVGSSEDDVRANFDVIYAKRSRNRLLESILNGKTQESPSGAADGAEASPLYPSLDYVFHNLKELDTTITPEATSESINHLRYALFDLAKINYNYEIIELAKESPEFTKTLDEITEPITQRLRDYKTHISNLSNSEILADDVARFYAEDSERQSKESYRAALGKHLDKHISYLYDRMPLASWRNEDIAGLIPELTNVLQNPEKIDAQVLTTKLDAFLGQQYDAAQQIISSEDFQIFQQQHNPHALAKLLEKMEGSQLQLARLNTLLLIAPMHYADQIDEIRPTFLAASQKAQSIAGFIDQSYSSIRQTILQMDNAAIADMMAAEPRLIPYKSIIERWKKSAIPNYDKVAALDVSTWFESIEKLQKSTIYSLEDNARKQLFAEGLAGVIGFRQKNAEAMGFRDTLDQFSFSNSAPHEIIDILAASSSKNAEKIENEFNQLNKLLPKKLNDGTEGKRYDWNEAKDIVCAAYSQLDPALGDLAKRAFDEEWILARKYGIDNPATIPSLPVRDVEGAHPFAAVNYGGDAINIIKLGHEMAHVLSNYIAGQKHGAFTYNASMMVQESFSHFGEVLIEREMLKRATDPHENIHLRYIFLDKELDALRLFSIGKFEEDLYALTKQKGSAITFDEINNLYTNHTRIFNVPDDVRSSQGPLWQIVNAPPHNISVYPTTKIMAAALYDAWEASPEQFRKDYHAIMEAGNTTNISELWDRLLGKGRAEQQAFIEPRIASIATRATALHKDLQAMPDLAVQPEPNVDAVHQAAIDAVRSIKISPASDVSPGAPLIGQATQEQKAENSKQLKPRTWTTYAVASKNGGKYHTSRNTGAVEKT